MKKFHGNAVLVIKHSNLTVLVVDIHRSAGQLRLFGDYNGVEGLVDIRPEKSPFQTSSHRRKSTEQIVYGTLKHKWIDGLFKLRRNTEVASSLRIGYHRIQQCVVVQFVPVVGFAQLLFRQLVQFVSGAVFVLFALFFALFDCVVQNLVYVFLLQTRLLACLDTKSLLFPFLFGVKTFLFFFLCF